MRIRFAAFTPERVDAQPPASAMIAQPRTWLEMVFFSVTVSVITHVIIMKVFSDAQGE
jgi:hypothetical protein